MKQKPVHPKLQPFLEGAVLLFDKPIGWTSFDVIRKLRNITRIAKIGHAGTLDPLATGLLIVCTGKFTKKINEYMGMEKEYTGTFTLGAVTPTYDLESEPEQQQDISHLSEVQIRLATHKFVGEIMQTPPIHSAIKKDGQPVYIAARKGIDVQLDPRPVTLYAFDVVEIEGPIVHFRVVCSTGTYIRSLANDFGKALGVGAYMSSLRRTRIGNFPVTDARGLAAFEDEIRSLIASEGQADT